MDSVIFSRSTFGVARVLMALCVFFCHVFERFNYFGFLFVGVFFFLSGFGMEKSSCRDRALLRIFPYIFYFVFFSLLYFVFFQKFPYPSSWFLVVYFLVMLLYRFFSRNIFILLFAFGCLAYFFIFLEFNWVWSASFGAFLFGVFFARNPGVFTFQVCSFFFPLSLFLLLDCPVALWCVLPLFSWFVLRLSSLFFFMRIAWLGQYTFFFYCVHCFVLGLFGVTWTLGGEPSFFGVVLAFLCSCFLSWFFKDFLFNIPEVKI